jgi:hypothetical protein
MGLSPYPAGDGRTWQPHGFTTDSTIFSLVGVANNAITLHMQDVNNNNQLYVCTGTWAIQGGGSTGQAIFTPSVADVTTGYLGKPGLYKVYPVVTLSTGAVPMDSQLVSVISEP